MQKIKKDDTVILIAGKDKGRHGKVMRVGGDRAVVEGLNLVKKHVKPNPNIGEQGGISEKEMSVHISNIAIYNESTKEADRVGIRRLEDGKKVRYFKSTGEVIDV